MKSFGFSLRLLTVLSSFVFGATLASAQTSLPGARVGELYSYAITTTPAAPVGTVYSATGLPTGLSINSSTGQISGTPTTAGIYTGTLSLALNSVTNNLNYSLVVAAAVGAPAITSATSASATVGDEFSYVLTANNSPTSYNVGTLPAGLGFDSEDHAIVGTPTSAGVYQISLSANNSSGTGATSTLTLTIAPAGPVPVVSSAATASGTLVPSSDPAAFTVSYQIAASESPESFAATGLPLGLSVNETTGLISGTTTIPGIYTVGLSAANNNGTGPTKNLTLTIGAVSTIGNAGTVNITVNRAMTPFTVTASNSPLSYNFSALPPGLSANSSTGVISGTPTALGTSEMLVSANNAIGAGPTATFTITVAAATGGGGGGGGGTPPTITSATSVNAVLNEPFTYQITATGSPTSYAASNLPTGVSMNTSTGLISGQFTVIGTRSIGITATNSSGSRFATLTVNVNSRPSITAQPQGAVVAVGGDVMLSVTATGSPVPTYQWRKNGVAITGAIGPSFALSDFEVADAGSYTVELTNAAGVVTSQPALVGVASAAKVTGSGSVVRDDVVHPNGNIYDQVLLTGTAATVTADPGQITRISFIDLDDDIVQVELSGPGTVTLTLENATGPATAVKYNQPDVAYMKGHASLVIMGVDETSHLSVFSVGRLTAFDPTGTFDLVQPVSPTNDPAANGSPLFEGHAGTNYDGIADIGLISIVSTDGKFGGIRTANAHYFRASGLTGIHAPGVAVAGPTFIGDITASDDATPVLIFGATTDVRIAGGSLRQLNDSAVQVDGITTVNFTDGTTSHGTLLPAQENEAIFEDDGVDVTDELVP